MTCVLSLASRPYHVTFLSVSSFICESVFYKAAFTSHIHTCCVIQGEQQDLMSSLDPDDPEPPHIKEEQEDPEPPHIKEEQEDPEPPHIKEEQEDPEPPHIKEEQEDLLNSQGGEQLQGLEEAGIKFSFTPVKSEEEAQSLQLHQRPEQMETEAAGAEPAKPSLVRLRPSPDTSLTPPTSSWIPQQVLLVCLDPRKLITAAPSRAAKDESQDVSLKPAGGETDLVSDLLKKPFSRRTFQEKWEIVTKGRPTPQLAALTQKEKTCMRHFQLANYERYSWLTASEKSCKLYCWECLLFATDRLGVWSHGGFANLTCLSKAATRHQSTAVHLQATVLFNTFGETRVDSEINKQVYRETEIHNEKVKKNREILKRLIDCVIFLGKQELSFRRHNKRRKSTNKGNYVELLSFVAEHDTDLHFHLSTNKVFTGTSGKIQNDLINAVAEVMGEEIQREINQAPFVAVMVDEATDVNNTVQLSLVLRYVTDTGVKERFVRFNDVTGHKGADDIAALLIRFLEDHNCLDKVVAQCYDGAAVMASGLNEVQAKVKEKAPMALFLHSYAYRLNLVLTQGVSKLKECRIFFSHLSGLTAYFSRSPKRTQLLDNICQRRLPHVAPTRWQNSSRPVNTVFENRAALQELFEHIVEHHDEYDDESVRFADSYKTLLENFDFCFLLSMFHGIFEYSNVLFGVLQKKKLDVQFCLKSVDEFCDTVEREKGRFGDIFDSTVCKRGAPRAQTGQAEGDIRAGYQKLHNDILDIILAQIRNRFKDHEKLMFLSLLDPKQFQAYRKKFPDSAFTNLTESHGHLFEDLPRLKTELTVMYAMAGFEEKGPADLLAFLQQNNLVKSMRQLYRLASLAVTIPTSTAAVEQTCSALKRIKTYSRNATGEARMSSLASMAIERDLLMELKRTDKLHNRAIDLFANKERRMDFVYK
ncbi:zinc finger MYM-type protein 1-like isoform X2 [Clinocottus analis]|uniref:zinc finger MYM-type protein 1-like isoform X2 n=1 Tax=Clinocottus analis TaxID=304258 RepID=UPI0035BEC7F4